MWVGGTPDIVHKHECAAISSLMGLHKNICGSNFLLHGDHGSKAISDTSCYSATPSNNEDTNGKQLNYVHECVCVCVCVGSTPDIVHK